VSSSPPSARRLTRGCVERRGRLWWNRFREEHIDPATGEVTRRQARMRLGEFRSAVGAAAELDRYLALLSAETLVPGLAITFGQYAARYDRLRIALMRRESRRAYRATIRTHLAPRLGHLPLSAIDATVIAELVAALHARGLARATTETVRNRLLGILRDARAAGFAAHAVTRSAVRLPSEQRVERERRHISDAELEQILAASSDPRRRALWAILGYAGLRIGEALALTWRHVDLGAGVLLVRQSAVAGEIAPLKTRQANRDVPMLPQLLTVLNEFRGNESGDSLLFATSTGKPLRSDDVRGRWLRPLLKRLGIAPAGCHAFRHGLPGRLDALGLSPASIQKFLGHASLSMTERYLHRSTADLREQLAAALRRREDEARPRP
jgi:integrase